MKLLSLSANKDSFHTVRFNREGISIILGKQHNPELSDTQKTYNGVGKSLVIALIHFCLGSNAPKDFKEKLSGWEFSLSFEISGKEYTSTRSTSFPNKIFFDNEEISVTKFRTKIETLLFNIPPGISNLTFRPLIKRFIRPSKESYLAYERVEKTETPYASLLINSFLLGLDIDLITTKYILKNEKERIGTFRKNLQTDSTFKDFFVGDKNPSLEIRDLNDEIERLEKDVKVFKVAENYYEIEKEANQTKRNLQEIKNQAIIIENSIENINRSLHIRPDISTAEIKRIFDEANSQLPESVIRNLSDLESFHNKLIESRTTRLSNEKNRLERLLEEKNKDITLLGTELNRQINYLNTYHALDELVELSNHLSTLKARAQKIKDYIDLLSHYEIETQDINIRLANENRRATEYLRDNSKSINEKLGTFRTLAKRFYTDKPGGLTIQNNDGDNQIRFNIDARIQDDESDGINEVKIYCFDMTILSERQNHHIDFIFHDSRLFSNMDPRQRSILFKITQEYSEKNNIQYIASLNEDQILSMKDQLSSEDFASILVNNVILELTDESDKSKLLGTQVDLQY